MQRLSLMLAAGCLLLSACDEPASEEAGNDAFALRPRFHRLPLGCDAVFLGRLGSLLGLLFLCLCLSVPRPNFFFTFPGVENGLSELVKRL